MVTTSRIKAILLFSKMPIPSVSAANEIDRQELMQYLHSDMSRRREFEQRMENVRQQEQLKRRQFEQGLEIGGLLMSTPFGQVDQGKGQWKPQMVPGPMQIGINGGVTSGAPTTNWTRSWQEQEPGDSGRFRYVSEYKDQPGQTFPGKWLEQDGEPSTLGTRGERHLKNFMGKFNLGN